MEPKLHKHLHALEEEIIQTGGLLKALQALECEDGAQISLIQALETQFKALEQSFYQLWKLMIADEDNA